MTTLKFVGDVSPWLGCLLAMLFAGLVWKTYRRESDQTPNRLQVVLPFLRSIAVGLSLLLLTGPVLQHREVIGELGRVHVYVDRSASMLQSDRHMPLTRKLHVAVEQGWLPDGVVDLVSLNAVEDFIRLAHRVESASGVSARQAAEILTAAERLELVGDEEQASQFDSAIRQPLRSLGQKSSDGAELQPIMARAIPLLEEYCARIDGRLQKRILAGDQALVSAVSAFDNSNRRSRLNGLLSPDRESLLTELEAMHVVTVHDLQGRSLVAEDFSSSPQQLPATGTADQIGAREGEADATFFTDLSTAITDQRSGQAVEQETNKSLGSESQNVIVLLTDGNHNRGPSPIQTSRILGGQGIPCFSLSFGAATTAEDVAIADVNFPPIAFRKDQVRGSINISDTLQPDRAFVVNVRHENDVLWQQELRSLGQGERIVEFSFPLESVVSDLESADGTLGRQLVKPLELVASVTPISGEADTGNNDRSFRLGVMTESRRVLLLDGRSRWETRYLRNIFERDEQWAVDVVIAGPGTEQTELPRGDQPNQFPDRRADLFEYDLIFFGELPPTLLRAEEWQWLREFVATRGGGLVFIDGARDQLHQMTDQQLADLLPVEWETSATTAFVPANLVLTDRGANEAAFQLLADSEENRSFWSRLPCPKQVASVSPVAGAEVLLQAARGEERVPAIVTRSYGAGRVVYLGFDETWRWRYKAADTWHQRVWNQLAKYTMAQPFTVSNEFVAIDSGKMTYATGESVPIRVRLRQPDGTPASGVIVEAVFRKDGQPVASIRLEGDANVPGVYRGRSLPMGPGKHDVVVKASGFSEQALSIASEFIVQPPVTGELTTTSANLELLDEMANVSRGRLIREGEAGQLIEALKPFSSGRVVTTETPLWQSYWPFIVIVAVLTIEWVLRKRAGLL